MKYCIVNPSNLNLKRTLESGQFFRWKFYNNSYFISSSSEVFQVSQRGSRLYFEGTSPEFIKKFFRLDDTFEEIIKSISKDAIISRAVELYPGLRILNQDPWETLITFMCSPASNFKRIENSVDCIATEYGEIGSICDMAMSKFPPPMKFNKRGLRKARLGFREERILYASRMVDDEFLASLNELNYDDAKKLLMQIKGIGEKVADCILLFGCNHLNAFPVDTWMLKGLRTFYLKDKKANAKKCAQFGREYFGKYAGYAQQYLYEYFREVLK